MKKKAFTLTELLVVVVIIGVLAAVVLPKFTQVLETRRTTEAEEIMRAVRSEQEARCTLDKNYVGEVDKAELASFPANEGNNYHYTLTATGIAAASRNKNYTLRIQSYRDGEICCDGDDCAHLGKTYPVCPARVAAVDECAAETACNLRSYSEACPSGQEGQVLFVPNADCTGYEQVNQCHDITVGPTTCSEGETRHVNRNCTGSSGERCEGGVWKPFTSTDDGTSKPGDTTTTCPTGEKVTCTYTCNDTTGAWEKTCGECTTSPCNGKQPSKGETYTELCVPNQPQVGSVYYTWNWETCEYDRNASGCKDCTKPTHNGERVYYLSDCPSPQVGSGTVFTWDESLCDYKKTGPYCSGDGEDGPRVWAEQSYENCVIVDCSGCLRSASGTAICQSSAVEAAWNAGAKYPDDYLPSCDSIGAYPGRTVSGDGGECVYRKAQFTKCSTTSTGYSGLQTGSADPGPYGYGVYTYPQACYRYTLLYPKK